MTKKKAKRTSRRTSKGEKKSVLTARDLYLSAKDENTVLLFAAGVLFGVGICVSILIDSLLYGGLAAIAVAVILLLIETRQ